LLYVDINPERLDDVLPNDDDLQAGVEDSQNFDTAAD